MVNNRVGTYGQTIRVDIGVSASQFTGLAGRDITAVLSAGSGNYSHEFSFDASTLFIGNSTINSSTEGVTFASGQWVWFQPSTAEAYLSAVTHTGFVNCSASGIYFKTPSFSFEIDT